MARTKKDLKNQAAAEEQMVGEGTALEGETLQQKPAGEQDGVPVGSLTDLELEHTGTLNPDAPQTESEAEEMGEVPQSLPPNRIRATKSAFLAPHPPRLTRNLGCTQTVKPVFPRLRLN